MIGLLLFDDGVGAWGTLTALRPVFDLRTGAMTTRERVAAAATRVRLTIDALVVPDHLAGVLKAPQQAGGGWASVSVDPPAPVNQPLPARECWLVINGRWADVDAVTLAMLRREPIGTAWQDGQGHILAAHLTQHQAQQWALTQCDSSAIPADVRLKPWTSAGSDAKRADASAPEMLLARPWHILNQAPGMLKADLRQFTERVPALAEPPVNWHAVGGAGVHLGYHARVMPGAVLVAEAGPIVVDLGAQIGPLAVIEGPCYIGANTTIAAHAHIRPQTVVGPHCRVGGEVTRSIFHSYSNKAHAGYLGDSLVGAWVNFGGDTNVSNLKNTWGVVRTQLMPDAPAEDTGRRNLGPIIGDYVRTAIGSRLLTGSCLGVGAMVAVSGFAPKFVPPMTFLTDAGAQPTRRDSFVATANAMMARHNQSLNEAQIDRLAELARAWQPG